MTRMRNRECLIYEEPTSVTIAPEKRRQGRMSRLT
jgi:hypothetical protein